MNLLFGLDASSLIRLNSATVSLSIYYFYLKIRPIYIIKIEYTI
jgi:hypothetical protein